MNRYSWKTLFILLLCIVMIFSCSITAFATEATYTIPDQNEVVTSISTIYFDVYGDTFGAIQGSCSIPAGSHTLSYSVTTSGWLNFYNPSYPYWSGHAIYVSGGGEVPLNNAYKITRWTFTPDQSVSYGYCFIVY